MERGRSPCVRAASRLRRSGGVVALALLGAHAHAQSAFTGPSKCVGCHDHALQAKRWQQDEPARLKNKAHYNTRKALDAPEGLAYAGKLGLADPYDLKGPCVGCHSTVFRGDASAGVSCESCHGAASAYLEPHQVKGSYAKAVAAGMRELRGKVDAIAHVCVACHVATDKRLAAAGHPAGTDFDLGASLDKIVHFESVYDSAQLRAAGRAALGGRSAAAGARPAAPAPAQPLEARAAARPAGNTSRAVPRPPAAAAAAPAEPAPWDWDQPIRPLPADYVPELVPEPSPAARAPAAEPAPLEPPAGAPLPALPPAPRASAPPPSIAEELALPMDLPGAMGGSAVSPALAPVPTPATPRSPAGARPPALAVAELRGRAGSLLEKLLRAGARVPDLPAPLRPVEFQGADSELLRLQDEVLALALEALRRPD